VSALLLLGAVTRRVFLGSPGASADDRPAGRTVKSIRVGPADLSEARHGRSSSSSITDFVCGDGWGQIFAFMLVLEDRAEGVTVPYTVHTQVPRCEDYEDPRAVTRTILVLLERWPCS
jgi:hypothetical protein